MKRLHSLYPHARLVILMAKRVEVEKQGNENTSSLLRKFSRRVRSAGFMQEVRNRRYYQRALSDQQKKERAIERLKMRDHYRRLYKQGRL